MLKRILFAALLVPLLALAQSYPSPTFNNLTVNGTFTATGKVGLGSLASQAANTFVGNVSGVSASPTAAAIPSCSTANSALKYTLNTGLSCGTTFALTSGNLSQFASTTSAQLLGIISDETGSGSLVFGTSPTIGTPTISGGTINNASVGATTPSTGAFTTLSASSTVGGAGFTNLFASPPSIGNVASAAGFFTTLNASGTFTGATISATTTNSSATVTVTDTGSSGANLKLSGNTGLGTPSKTLRAVSGNFGIINDGLTQQILTLTDSGNLSVVGSVTPSQTAGIVGTTTNNNANAGAVGEFICAQVTNGGSPTGCATNSSTPVSLTSNTPANVTSVSLTAGDWDCRGNVVFNNGGTTVTTQSTGSINTTSATNNTLQFANYSPPSTAGLNPAFAVPTVRESLSATTTVYLVVNNVFSTSTSAAYGRIECRRAR